MKDLLILLGHLLTTIARLLGPGGEKGRDRRQSVDEAAAPGYESNPETCTPSNRSESLSVRVLITFSQSAPYRAGCHNTPTIDAAEIPPPAQTAQIPTAVCCWPER
jgi:hypothetical protein